MLRPTLEEAERIAASGNYRVIPISMEMYADVVTPVEVLKILKNEDDHCFMLESAEDCKGWGRYTFLGFDPIMEITCSDGVVNIRTDNTETIETNDPDRYIRKILKDHKSPRFEYLPPFTGGLVGYFSYDYVKYKEPALNLKAKDSDGFNDVDLMLFDKVIAFDHYRQKIVLIVNVRSDNIKEGYSKGISELNRMLNLILEGRPLITPTTRLKSKFKPLFTEEEFCAAVDKAKEQIRNGDIFQVVLSNRLEADFEGSLLDAYRKLRTTNPSPYMFYMGGHDIEVAGASPETLLKLQDGKLYTFPLAGTRPRGNTKEEDLALEKNLLSDEKELAEHNMLVDLGRNDLAKISKIGSVAVDNYLSVLRFSHVMHIGSTVSGNILEDKDGVDAVNAVLPAGTLSGAPKMRAMQIIDELENNKRGIYGGAIGYLDLTGNVDTCIAIRIAYKKNGKVFIRAGAGIVADSVPEKEYQECVNKMKAVRNAIEWSDGGN
ncbi:MAG: anthranilate synthase component I [Methanomassiliicoccaceae archaeon]|jgi:anthranilate synthase component 1|nr:anthranilate synthase component I [Methanomassiliicoccaceae archaeon]